MFADYNMQLQKVMIFLVYYLMLIIFAPFCREIFLSFLWNYVTFGPDVPFKVCFYCHMRTSSGLSRGGGGATGARPPPLKLDQLIVFPQFFYQNAYK